MLKTGYVWEKIYTEHVMSSFHPESPLRLQSIKEILDNSDMKDKLVKIPARLSLKEEIAWIHDSAYIDLVEGTKGRTVDLDPDTTACPKTWEAACMAVGGGIEAVKAVLKKRVNNAYAFLRPPGHHAEQGNAMGFCIFNNIAVAAEYAIKKHDLKRVAIIDFDIHHGNGTEQAFYKRSDVFYISTHRWPFYPGTGAANERGEGLGKGYNLNIPMQNGDDEDFYKVYHDTVVPEISIYKPELILVSAGYDAHNIDPLGGFNLTTDFYNWLTSELLKTANKICNGKIVFFLEGGYNTKALADCTKNALRIMTKK